MNIFSSLIYYITKPFGYLLYLCYLPFKDYGLAILFFTLITQLLLFPLAIKQQRSTAEMARMRPKMEQLQKKYAKDRERLQQETMALYQEEGYSPMSGCLPMLVQIPILMLLYNVIVNPLTYIMGMTSAQIDTIQKFLPALTKSEAGRREIFLAKDLADSTTLSGLIHTHHLDFLNQIHAVNFHFFGIKAFDLSVIPQFKFEIYVLIPILCYITSVISTWMSMKMNESVTPQETQKMNKSMILFMPLISAFFAFSVPAAMGWYWICMNLIMILRVVILNRFYHPLKLAEEAEQRAQEKRQRRIEAGLARPRPEETDETQGPVSDKPAVNRPPVKKNGTYSKSQLKKLNKQRLAQAREKEQDKER